MFIASEPRHLLYSCIMLILSILAFLHYFLMIFTCFLLSTLFCTADDSCSGITFPHLAVWERPHRPGSLPGDQRVPPSIQEKKACMFSEHSRVFRFTLQRFPFVGHRPLGSPLPPAAKQMPQLLVLQVTQNSIQSKQREVVSREVGWLDLRFRPSRRRDVPFYRSDVNKEDQRRSALCSFLQETALRFKDCGGKKGKVFSS